MGQKWDGGDIAFCPETWATAASVLRPGGFLLAFGGTRTYHRLATAIEAGGFVIQDSILDLISSDARVQRFVATLAPSQVDAFSQILDDLQPSGSLAWAFGSGFPKGRSQLKPAFEPIVLAYKPGGKRELQIEESRIQTDEVLIGGACKLWSHYRDSKEPSSDRRYTENGGTNFAATPGPRGGSPSGRWPANIAHDGSDEVMQAFAAFGERASGIAVQRNGGGQLIGGIGIYGGATPGRVAPDAGYTDSGTAARFFFCAKAGAQDRWGGKHPTVKPVELMKWLIPLVTPKGGAVLDCFAGSGTTGIAAMATGRNAILIEKCPEYCADIRERIAHYEGEGRHSLVSKARHRERQPIGGLFDD